MDRNKPFAPVMRAMPLQPQARLLPLRSRRAPDASACAPAAGDAATGATMPASVQAATAGEVMERARQQGHAEGFANGREAGYAAGREAGLIAGHKDGIAASRKAASEDRERLATLLQSATWEMTRTLDYAEDAMIALAFDIACRVVGEAAVSREAIAHQLRQALAAQLAAPLLAVRLHPQDLRELRDDPGFLALLEKAGILARVEWIADARMDTGGCMLDSAAGSLDARLESRMQGLRAALLATRQARREGDTRC